MSKSLQQFLSIVITIVVLLSVFERIGAGSDSPTVSANCG